MTLKELITDYCQTHNDINDILLFSGWLRREYKGAENLDKALVLSEYQSLSGGES